MDIKAIRELLLEHKGDLVYAIAQVDELLALTHEAPAKWLWPVAGIPHRVTQLFDAPVSYGKHEGVDFDCYDDARQILCPILACDDGVVLDVNKWDGTRGKDAGLQNYGNWVLILHGIYSVRYCHLGGFSVKPGENVARGYIIGVGGNTGNSKGAHLHLTVLHPDAAPVYVYQQRAVNPLPLLED